MDSNFVNNIIPRLRRFTQIIEVKKALVDKVWVIYGDTDLIEYEFERTGEIAVTKNGTTYDGSWKIMGSGRLRIRTDFANNTLDYDFSVPGILVMKIAGLQNNPFILFNPKIVENGNIGKYLEKLEGEKVSRKLTDSNLEYKEALTEEEKTLAYLFLAVFLMVILVIAIFNFTFSN